jgi:hypothetical protein
MRQGRALPRKKKTTPREYTAGQASAIECDWCWLTGRRRVEVEGDPRHDSKVR